MRKQTRANCNSKHKRSNFIGEDCTRGVSIGCAVVEDANSSCCRLWIRMHLT